jgi:hypothetical protein
MVVSGRLTLTLTLVNMCGMVRPLQPCWDMEIVRLGLGLGFNTFFFLLTSKLFQGEFFRVRFLNYHLLDFAMLWRREHTLSIWT